MQAIPAAPRVLRERPCEGCGTTFRPATATNRHCLPCQDARTVVLRREAQVRRRAGTNKRFCEGCGVELPAQRGRPAKRCPPCRETYWTAFDQARNKARTASGERKVYDQHYRDTSGEQIREANRRYRQAHPETDLAAIHRRRQRRDHGMTAEDRALSAAYRRAIRDDPCFYCGSAKTRCDVDHFFPLSKGGTDHWWNLVPACRRCNLAKSITCGTAFLLAA